MKQVVDSRIVTIRDFLDKHGYADAVRRPIMGDASFRRYERLHFKEVPDETTILMDSPPAKVPCEPFINVAEWLHAVGLSAPQILAKDAEAGALLLEDFGEGIFAGLMKQAYESSPAAGKACEEELYRAAIDTLVSMQAATPPAWAEAYSREKLLSEVMLLVEWYLPYRNITLTQQQKQQFIDIWNQLLVPILEGPKVLVHRDYHAENLFWLPEREGAKRVGLIDFQDAVVGHPAYDVMSLLEDARRDVSPAMAKAMLQYYRKQSTLDLSSFDRAYAILAAQRNIKIIGIFVRLAVRDRKDRYLQLLPRVWRYLVQDLARSELQPMRRWLNDVMGKGAMEAEANRKMSAEA